MRQGRYDISGEYNSFFWNTPLLFIDIFSYIRGMFKHHPLS